jgi:hypothetical protein
MCPQRIFGNETYTPEGIAMMRQAFDIVWERMAPGVTKNGAEAARSNWLTGSSRMLIKRKAPKNWHNKLCR